MVQVYRGRDRARCRERKEVLQGAVLGYKEVSMFGKQSYELTPTSSLNTQQFTLFIEKIQAWAASELGIVLPIPEDLIFQQFLEYYEDR